VKPVAKFGKATRSGKECSGKDKEQAIAVLDEDCIMDAELHSDSPSYLPHLAEELRESRVGKARVVNILTPTPTPTSRKASSNDLPIISSTSSLRKTSIGWEATSTVSRKVSAGKTSTTMMLPIKTQIIEAPNRTHDAGSSWSCGVCGKKLRSLELANIHATKAGHTKEFHKLNKDIVGIADSSLHEESPVEEDVVETSPSSPLQAQSSKATDVKTSTSIAHLDTTRKVRSGLWQHDTPIVFKAPTSTSYAMAPAVGPDHYQCRWGDCDFHDNPHKLACHVLKTHLDSDWTLEGFKCEWSACTDRVRLVRGIHQHCLDVHIPPLERPFWSGPLPPLHSQPQHSRQVKFQVETREKDGSEAQFEHEVATAAIQETEHTTDSTQETTHEADPDRMDIVINLMKESVISLTQESEFEVDSDSSPDVEPEHGGPEQDTEPTTDSSEETETENESKAVLSSPPLPSVLNSTRSTSLYLPHTTLATLTPSRGGLRQYLPIFSNFSSPFTSCFSIGGKRKRGSESGDKENVEDTEEIGNTPSKGNKRIKIGGDGKKVVKGRDLALGRSHRWSMGFG
jgi:hypothetical protein